MKSSLLLGLVALCFTCTATVQAGRYGSETRVTIEGSFRTEKPDVSQELSKGGVRVTRAHAEADVSNATILAALKRRGLIVNTKGYSIVMVAPGHMADGIKFFAVREGAAPVGIPTDLLSLEVEDGPGKGVMQENAKGRLTKLDMETVNFATLKLKNFEGTGVLEQAWSMETVTKGDVTEAVELVKGAGFFSGKVTGKKDGVGLIALRLSKAKTVGLKRYGMVTTSTGGTDGSFGGVEVTTGTVTLNPGGIGTVDIHPGQHGTMTFYTESIGLTLAYDGAPFSTANITLLNELTINTAEGPVAYTREEGDIWTIVEPEEVEPTMGEGEPVE